MTKEKFKPEVTTQKIRVYLSSCGFDSTGMSNAKVVIEFAKRQFDEDIDPSIKNKEAYDWVEKRMKNYEFDFYQFKKSKYKIKAEKKRLLRQENHESTARKQPVNAKDKNPTKGAVAKKKLPTYLADLEPIKDRSMPYNVFLRTGYWKHIKAVVKFRDENKCTNCGDDKKLVVHHLTYKNHFNEHLHTEDLITLCDQCHNNLHKNKFATDRPKENRPTLTENQINFESADVVTRLGHKGIVYFNEPLEHGKMKIYSKCRKDDYILSFEHNLIFTNKHKKQVV